MLLRFLFSEVGRSVFLFGTDSGRRLDVQVALGRLPVFLMSELPQHPCGSSGIVSQRNKTGIYSGIAILLVGIVERRATHPHRDLSGPAAEFRGIEQAAQPTDHDGPLLVIHRVADEVRSRVGLGEGIFRALQFRLHRCEEDAGIGFRTRRGPAERSARDNDGD